MIIIAQRFQPQAKATFPERRGAFVPTPHPLFCAKPPLAWARTPGRSRCRAAGPQPRGAGSGRRRHRRALLPPSSAGEHRPGQRLPLRRPCPSQRGAGHLLPGELVSPAPCRFPASSGSANPPAPADSHEHLPDRFCAVCPALINTAQSERREKLGGLTGSYRPSRRTCASEPPRLSPCTSSRQTSTRNLGFGPPDCVRPRFRASSAVPPGQMSFAMYIPGCAFISVPFVFCQNISLCNFTQGETGV